MSWNRGAFLETIDLPLNNAPWLLAQMEEVERLPDEQQRRARIKALLDRSDPGAGGRYDNFGAPESLPHAGTENWETDPGRLTARFTNFALGLLHPTETQRAALGPPHRNWINSVNTLYDTPLRIAYDGLDSSASYRLRITYLWNWFGTGAIRLTANDGHVVHEKIQVEKVVETKEFILPGNVLRNGRLELAWTTEEGSQGANVAELWLEKIQG